MTTSTKLVKALKQALKTRGITYKALADRLDLSESAIKQMFSTGNLSLKRLDELCAVLELDIADLVNLTGADEPKMEQLPAEYEQEIVADNRLLLFAYCLINYWQVDEILDRYQISPEESIRYLRRLDQMKLIEALPGNRVRLLIANNFKWRKNGAIERFFRSKVQMEFFDSDFTDDGAVRIVKNGMLSKKSQLQLAERLQAIGELFDDASAEERKLPASQRQGTTMVLAIRNWFFEGFRELER